MALLDSTKIHKIDKSKVSVHKPVQCTYSVFEEGGKRYFQIDTYGSEDREIHHKLSQSIQFDEETARVLIELVSDELGL